MTEVLAVSGAAETAKGDTESRKTFFLQLKSKLS